MISAVSILCFKGLGVNTDVVLGIIGPKTPQGCGPVERTPRIHPHLFICDHLIPPMAKHKSDIKWSTKLRQPVVLIVAER